MEMSWMKHPPRKILLATDLSARCDRATDRAVALAALWKARLVAVHAMPDAPDDDTIPAWPRPQDPQKLAESRVRAEMREQLPDVTVVIGRGNPSDVIARVAEEQGCDLIVTGVARDEPLGRLMLGNTVDRLVRRSPVPVLIVRKRGTKPYLHVVAATDYSEPSRHALAAAVMFFPRARLTVFHAYERPPMRALTDTKSFVQPFLELAVSKGNEFLQHAELSGLSDSLPELIVVDGDPSHLLHDLTWETDVDVVALGSQGRSALSQALLGSVAQRSMRLLPCDVLIVREPREGAG